jgi:hypothetical protein
MKRAGIAIIIVSILGLGVFGYLRLRTPPYMIKGRVDVHKAIQYWQERINLVGPERAHEEMIERGKTTAQQHTLAHAFGEALYDSGDLSKVRYCGNEYLYGCYHQFIGLAALQFGISVVGELKNACGSANGDVRCAHGIGHGILAAVGYSESDVNRSLSLCHSLYEESEEQGTCADGVFMEYNLQEMTELGSEGLLDRSPRPYKESEAYQPCLRLKEFQPECVYEQPLWWSYALMTEGLAFDDTLPKMGELCRTLSPSEEMKRVCFVGIGFPVAQYKRFDIPKIIAACAMVGSGDERVQCLVGSARRFIDNAMQHDNICADIGLTGRDEMYCKQFSFGPRDAAIRAGIPYPSAQ